MTLGNYKFELEKAAIFKAVKLSGNPLFGKASLFKKISFLFLVIVGLLFIISISEITDIKLLNNFLLGLVFLFFGLFLVFWQINAFFENKIKHPHLINLKEALNNQNSNLAEFFDFKTALAFHKSKRKPSLFFYHLFKDSDFIFIFARIGIEIGALRKTLTKIKNEDSNLLTKIIEGAIIETRERGGKRIKKNDILISATENYPFLQGLFAEKGIDKKDIQNLSNWVYQTRKKSEEKKKFWEWKNLIKKGSLAKDWASGYTIFLDRFSDNWTKIFQKRGFPEIIGHKDEIKAVERILAGQNNNNVLLVGETGVGKKSIIYDLARRSFYGESLPELNHKRIIEFDIPFLLANISSQEEIERMFNEIFNEVARSDNTILVIDNLDNFVGREIKPGIIDISAIITSYCSSSQFKVIGITDLAGYRQVVERSSIGSFFEKVDVLEISTEEIIKILQNRAFSLENRHQKIISYPSLKEIINISSKYFPSVPFPEKAINLLEEAINYLTQKRELILLPEHIISLVSEKLNIPIGEAKEKERNLLLNLEGLLHKKIINQKEAIKEVSSALRRSRAEIAEGSKPMGTFLFLGPTGTGKTETAKALAEIYFGSLKELIRIDMSEFQSLADISRLIGSADYEGILTTKMKENPFSLLLLDEIEKAHPDILNIFLQVLDEGHITDGLGQKIDFKSSIIIATSNAGSELIFQNIQKKLAWSGLKEKLLNHLFSKAIFRPEFINRFDAVVLFSVLSKENLLDIVDILLQKIVQRLKNKNIELVITRELKERIVEIGYNPLFGAREIKRVIQDKVENALAKALISGNLQKGKKIKIDSESFEVEVD